MKNKLITEKIEEFERKFCNNHQKPIRFLRSIFYDEQDGAEQIELFLIESLSQVYQSAIEDIERGLPEFLVTNFQEDNYEAGYNEAVIQIEDLLNKLKDETKG